MHPRTCRSGLCLLYPCPWDWYPQQACAWPICNPLPTTKPVGLTILFATQAQVAKELPAKAQSGASLGTAGTMGSSTKFWSNIFCPFTAHFFNGFFATFHVSALSLHTVLAPFPLLTEPAQLNDLLFWHHLLTSLDWCRLAAPHSPLPPQSIV